MTERSRDQETAKARAVKDTYEAELLSKANVVGVGVGLEEKDGASTGKVAVVVMVSEKVPAKQLAKQDIIPPVLDGIPVDVQEVGRLSIG